MKALQRQLPFVQQDKDATSVWKASSNSEASGSAIIASPGLKGGGGGAYFVGGLRTMRTPHHASATRRPCQLPEKR